MASSQTGFESLVLQAWHGKLDMTGLLEQTNRFEADRQFELAAVLYQTWLARNSTPVNHFVYFNLGVALFNAGDAEGAKAVYRRAIELAPNFVNPHFSLAVIHECTNQIDEAIAEWTWVAEHASPDIADQRALRVSALNNLGRVHENARRYDEAHAALTKSLRLAPMQPDVLHHWVFLRAKQCEWPVYATIDGVDPQATRDATSALAMISLSDDPAMQLAAARNYVKAKIDLDVPALTNRSAYGHDKIRIGYLSSDFCLHPVSMLTVELFELHDRERFEVYGYCWSRDDGSALRQRVIGAMDHFERIDHLSDEAAARLLREHEIDILVDLQGQTLGARPQLLAYRPAPVQITYLGLPATTGLPFIDYVIADEFLIPRDSAQYYAEKPLYMPDVYQVSDRKRISGPAPSRESCGLPRDGFVFSSFNNNYKYTPEVFAVWMNILKRVPGSVLWLLADNPWAQANLRREATRLGVDEARLVFAPRVSPENYLARYATADLFLDTYPFNAGTTANDALWMGLPVLTCTGRTFASRMAGALLTGAGMQELITRDLGGYEEKAVVLANDPAYCRKLREQLGRVRESGVLFDTPRFTRHLEDHFVRLVGELG
ncbi:tetratricopeptide repeat protein [Burkholderia sp. WP9]|uniref:O-linked N-acetylglucosamine transferase, SPINDLY family protein n=1 Tax=Burkholderia sp. WP9 TaxID=1500263 RepID=UPI000B86E5A2|nr:tetratricopeptide repeat protein [Burkholderia sp. WP9]